LNQTEISNAYVAADVLVLPSDYGETWGLVVNEAMASGLPCIVSDRCGCAEDLGTTDSNLTFASGDVRQLAEELANLRVSHPNEAHAQLTFDKYSLSQTVDIVNQIWQ
jgi:glycosyltransferase involved in cell wall biosynthesis